MLSKLVGPSGEVEFDALVSEDIQMSNRVSSFAVESGQDVADHISLEANGIPISGVISGDGAAQKLSTLRDFRNKREVLRLIGRNVMSNVVIENLTTRHNARSRDGFEFEIQLRSVRIAQLQEVQIAVPAPSVSQTQTKPVQSKGIQQPKTKSPTQSRTVSGGLEMMAL